MIPRSSQLAECDNTKTAPLFGTTLVIATSTLLFLCLKENKSVTVLWCFHTRARQWQDNKTNVESVHSYEAFHTRSDKPGVKGIIGMHRFNICLVVVLLWCENTISILAAIRQYGPCTTCMVNLTFSTEWAWLHGPLIIQLFFVFF